jgi:hypothetical protein
MVSPVHTRLVAGLSHILALPFAISALAICQAPVGGDGPQAPPAANSQASVLALSKPSLGVLLQHPPTRAELRPSFSVESNPNFHPAWLKRLEVESFGYTAAPLVPGFDLSPGYTASLFDRHGMECPRCLIGPVVRARFTLPPFGSNATLKLRNDRVELFSGFGGLEAFKPDGTYEPKGRQTFTSTYGDAWLVQSEVGGRFSVDRSGHFWLGATGRYLYNFGSGPQRWKTLTGDATFRFGR